MVFKSNFLCIRYENENDTSFLESFEAVAQKHEQRRQKIKKDVKKIRIVLID